MHNLINSDNEQHCHCCQSEKPIHETNNRQNKLPFRQTTGQNLLFVHQSPPQHAALNTGTNVAKLTHLSLQDMALLLSRHTSRLPQCRSLCSNSHASSATAKLNAVCKQQVYVAVQLQCRNCVYTSLAANCKATPGCSHDLHNSEPVMWTTATACRIVVGFAMLKFLARLLRLE